MFAAEAAPACVGSNELVFTAINGAERRANQFKGIAVAADGFRGSQKQVTTTIQRQCHAFENVLFALTGKINQYISAEDDVELAQRAESLQQVLFTETHSLPDFVNHPPAIVATGKKLLLSSIRQTSAGSNLFIFPLFAWRQKYPLPQSGWHQAGYPVFYDYAR